MVGKLGFSLILAFLLLGSSFAVTAWASHDGPIFYVDDDNPESDDFDGDYHFNSLAAVFDSSNSAFPSVGENDLIIVDPGTYNGSITISVKGVILKAPEGRDLTKFVGQITITAKDVQVIGLDVDATGQSAAFVVQNDNVMLEGNKAHNSSEAGILVEAGSDNVTLKGNEVFNNGTEGILVRSDSDSAVIENNQARSNGAIGIFVSGSSDRVSVSNNGVSLNQSEGIKVQDSDLAEVRGNSVTNNALDGIRFEDANDGNVLENSVSSSGGYGISLVDSDNNSVRQNELASNDGGGIALRGSQASSKRNIVEGNTITGNIRAGSEGLLLEGDVSSNVILGNTIANNSFGIRFKSTSMGGAPSNNVIDGNDIKDSPEDGIELSGSAGRNQIRKNTLSGNNKAGIRANNENGNDQFENNEIFNNGQQGIIIDASARNTVAHNEIRDNGRAGIALVNGASNNNVIANIVSRNRSDGIAISGGSNSNDLEDNTVSGNRQNGVLLENVNKLDVRGNTIKDNVAHGIEIVSSSDVDVENNQINGNNTGGIFVSASATLDIEQNDILDNTQFGLSATPDTFDLKADRNWWGAARGPAGVFEGTGNAALGVVVADVFPWLTAPFAHLRLGSTAGEIIDDFGFDDPASFLAQDKADIDVNFFKVDPEEDGMIIVSKFETDRPEALSSLNGALKAISVLVSGLRSGTTLIDVKYKDSELPPGVNKDTLRLFYYDGSRWVQLDGRSRSNVNIVEGELPVAVLRDGVILAIAPGGN